MARHWYCPRNQLPKGNAEPSNPQQINQNIDQQQGEGIDQQQDIKQDGQGDVIEIIIDGAVRASCNQSERTKKELVLNIMHITYDAISMMLRCKFERQWLICRPLRFASDASRAFIFTCSASA